MNRTTEERLNELQELAEQCREVLYCAIHSADNIARQNTLLAAGYRLAGQIETEVNETQQSIC